MHAPIRAEYAIEFLEEDGTSWTQLYVTTDRRDADEHWRRLKEMGRGRPTRMVQLDVLREYPGDGAP